MPIPSDKSVSTQKGAGPAVVTESVDGPIVKSEASVHPGNTSSEHSDDPQRGLNRTTTAVRKGGGTGAETPLVRPSNYRKKWDSEGRRITKGSTQVQNPDAEWGGAQSSGWIAAGVVLLVLCAACCWWGEKSDGQSDMMSWTATQLRPSDQHVVEQPRYFVVFITDDEGRYEEIPHLLPTTLFGTLCERVEELFKVGNDERVELLSGNSVLGVNVVGSTLQEMKIASGNHLSMRMRAVPKDNLSPTIFEGWRTISGPHGAKGFAILHFINHGRVKLRITRAVDVHYCYSWIKMYVVAAAEVDAAGKVTLTLAHVGDATDVEKIVIVTEQGNRRMKPFEIGGTAKTDFGYVPQDLMIKEVEAVGCSEIGSVQRRTTVVSLFARPGQKCVITNDSL